VNGFHRLRHVFDRIHHEARFSMNDNFWLF